MSPSVTKRRTPSLLTKTGSSMVEAEGVVPWFARVAPMLAWPKTRLAPASLAEGTP